MTEINNLTKARISRKFLQKIARDVLKEEKPREKIDLSIALVNSARIRELNRVYLKKNKPTDVLSFAEDKKFLGKFKILKNQKSGNLGEIIICPSEVRKNAKKFGFYFRKELARVLIHGILHLLNYEHEGSKEASRIMEKKQQYYLLKS